MIHVAKKKITALAMTFVISLTTPLFPESIPEFVSGADHPSLLVEERIISEGLLDLPPDAELHVSFTSTAPEISLGIELFNFEASSGRFAGKFSLHQNNPIILRGRVDAVLPILLPLRRISEGEIISWEDVKLAKMPASSISAHMLRQGSEILGKEAKRALVPGRPIAAKSLVEPRIIKRGDKITIRYIDGILNLTAPGRALQDGASNQMLRVVNLQSSKTISAKVFRAGIVTVEPMSTEINNKD
jgi:flagella basal body P-ring formation protein FlgA